MNPFERLPEGYPAAGFYAGYKRSPHDPIGVHMYEVLAPPYYAGDSSELKGVSFVLYRPLSKDAPVYKAGRGYDLKLLHEFLAPAKLDGRVVPRYTHISDLELIIMCKGLCKALYGQEIM